MFFYPSHSLFYLFYVKLNKTQYISNKVSIYDPIPNTLGGDVSFCRCFVSPTFIQASYQHFCCISQSIIQLAPNNIEAIPKIISLCHFAVLLLFFFISSCISFWSEGTIKIQHSSIIIVSYNIYIE